MNEAARQHLDNAEGYLARGDAFYRKAAEAVIAAQKADTTLSNREIGKRFGRSERWVRTLVTWVTTSEPETPIDWQRGSHATQEEIKEGARKLLAVAPMEEVEHVITSLPTERVVQIADAAQAEMEAANERERKERQPGKRAGLDVLVTVIGKARKSYMHLEKSYQAAHESELTDDQKEVLSDYLNKISQLTEWYREFMETGSVDDELGKLLS